MYIRGGGRRAGARGSTHEKRFQGCCSGIRENKGVLRAATRLRTVVSYLCILYTRY